MYDFEQQQVMQAPVKLQSMECLCTACHRQSWGQWHGVHSKLLLVRPSCKKLPSTRMSLFVVFAGMPIVPKATENAALCQAEVKGPLGHLCRGVLLDTSCTKELQLSEHKAIQLGITASPPMYRDGSSSSYITRR